MPANALQLASIVGHSDAESAEDDEDADEAALAAALAAKAALVSPHHF